MSKMIITVYHFIHLSRYYEEDYDKHSIQRSLSQPSLARSASEFTERWIAPEMIEHEHSSPESSPRGRRRAMVSHLFNNFF